MLLCLDIGNTHIFGGVFDQEKLLFRFRYATHLIGTADQLGIFLLNILQLHQISSNQITQISTSSVVPHYDYTIKHCFVQYFKAQYFNVEPGVVTGLNIKYKNPNEVGADKIVNAIGAVEQFPNQNIIVVDMGTATTVCAITKQAHYLGGVILPGIRVCMEALSQKAAKLMPVEITASEHYLGQTTRQSIQSGLFYGQLGALKEIIQGIRQEVFKNEAPIVLGTGGFSQMYQSLFDCVLPDLVLHGLRVAFSKNQSNKVKEIG